MKCLFFSNVKVYRMPDQKENTMRRHHKLLFLMAIIFLSFLIVHPSLYAKPVYKSNPYYDIHIITKTLENKTHATITVNGKSGYYCNTLYSWKLSLDPKPGIVLDKKIFKNRDAKKFSKAAVIFEVPYVIEPKQKISATLKFSVCSEKQCLIEKVPLSW